MISKFIHRKYRYLAYLFKVHSVVDVLFDMKVKLQEFKQTNKIAEKTKTLRIVVDYSCWCDEKLDFIQASSRYRCRSNTRCVIKCSGEAQGIFLFYLSQVKATKQGRDRMGTRFLDAIHHNDTNLT